MNDVEFKLSLMYEGDLSNDTVNQASYIINDACSQLEGLKFFVSYQVKVNGSNVVIKDI